MYVKRRSPSLDDRTTTYIYINLLLAKCRLDNEIALRCGADVAKLNIDNAALCREKRTLSR